MLRCGLVTEVSLLYLGGNGHADGEGMSLSERTGSILDTVADIKLRVSGRDTSESTEAFEVIERHPALHGEGRVECGAHVAGIEEEAVALRPKGIIGVGDEVLAVKHLDEVGYAEGTAHVPGAGFLHHSVREGTDVVRGSFAERLCGHVCSFRLNSSFVSPIKVPILLKTG